jgi:Leucine rich repeat
LLDKNTLTGTMARNGAISRSLYELSLSKNYLSGSLPWLTGTTNLQRLMLSENNFDGTIPDSWRNLTTLTALDLGNQRDISGSISDFLPSWTSLTYLSLRETNLSVNLSDVLSHLSSLGKGRK